MTKSILTTDALEAAVTGAETIDFAHQILEASKSAQNAANILSNSLSLDLRQLAVVENLYFAKAQAAAALAQIEFVLAQRAVSATPAPADRGQFERFVDDTAGALKSALLIRGVLNS